MSSSHFCPFSPIFHPFSLVFGVHFTKTWVLVAKKSWGLVYSSRSVYSALYGILKTTCIKRLPIPNTFGCNHILGPAFLLLSSKHSHLVYYASPYFQTLLNQSITSPESKPSIFSFLSQILTNIIQLLPHISSSKTPSYHRLAEGR